MALSLKPQSFNAMMQVATEPVLKPDGFADYEADLQPRCDMLSHLHSERIEGSVIDSWLSCGYPIFGKIK